jgi:hypothetical protein
MVMSVTPRNVPDFEWCTFSPFRGADDGNGNEHEVDDLDFQPRLQDMDDAGLDDLLTPTAKNNKKKCNTNQTDESTPDMCFDKVRLVSPEFFTDAEVQERAAKGDNNWREQFYELNLNGDATPGNKKDNSEEVRNAVSSPLANMVHPMNLDLFIADTSPGKQAQKITRSESPAKVKTMTIQDYDKENDVHNYSNHNTKENDYDYDRHPKYDDHIPDDASDAMSDVTMKSRSSVRSVSSAPAAQSKRRTRLGSNIFRMDRYRQGKKDKKNKHRASGDAGDETAAEHSAAGDNNSQRSFSSFLSSCSNNSRISYSLKSGRRGMSREERKFARELLRNQTIVTTATASAAAASKPSKLQEPEKPYYCKEEKKEEEPVQTATTTVSKKEEEAEQVAAKDIPTFIFVLLVEPAQKIFEVVKIDPSAVSETTGASPTSRGGKSAPLHLSEGGLTVGDVLAQARTGATDPALASQKYVSLCNGMQELAAPMLPVDLLSRPNKDKGGDNGSERKKRRKFPEMLMAVPEGSTADVVRQIHSRLMQNPRMQRWWRQQDPFDSSSKKKKDSKKKSSRHSHKSSTTTTPIEPASGRAVVV